MPKQDPTKPVRSGDRVLELLQDALFPADFDRRATKYSMAAAAALAEKLLVVKHSDGRRTYNAGRVARLVEELSTEPPSDKENYLRLIGVNELIGSVILRPATFGFGVPDSERGGLESALKRRGLNALYDVVADNQRKFGKRFPSDPQNVIGAIYNHLDQVEAYSTYEGVRPVVIHWFKRGAREAYPGQPNSIDRSGEHADHDLMVVQEMRARLGILGGRHPNELERGLLDETDLVTIEAFAALARQRVLAPLPLPETLRSLLRELANEGHHAFLSAHGAQTLSSPDPVGAGAG